MQISRRSVLISGTAIISTIGESPKAEVTKEDEHIAILLTNLHRDIDPYYSQFEPLMAEVTRQAFAHIITDKRIQVQPMIAPVDQIDGQTFCAHSRMLGIRCNLSPTKVDLYREAYPEIVAVIASEIGFEYQQMLLLQRELIWAPYVLAMPVFVIDPNTFEPKVGFKTRYALQGDTIPRLPIG